MWTVMLETGQMGFICRLSLFLSSSLLMLT